MIDVHHCKPIGARVACFALGLLISACASNRGVMTTESIADAMRAAEDPSLTQEFAVLPPSPAPAPVLPQERFDVDVANVPAESFFRSLVEGTSQNLIVHPDVSGLLSLSLKQVTLMEVLESVRDVYGYDFRSSGAAIIILPATLQSRVFEIDYLNLTRNGQSRTRVSSGQVSQVATSGTRQRSGIVSDAAPAATGDQTQRETTGSVIDTINSSDFWSDLGNTLQQILGAGEGRQIVVNSQSGVIYARGMPEELRAVDDPPPC